MPATITKSLRVARMSLLQKHISIYSHSKPHFGSKFKRNDKIALPLPCRATGQVDSAISRLLAQVRAEVIGCILAALCITVPAVSKQLDETATGKGRKSSSNDLPGSGQIFKLAEGLSESAKQVTFFSD